MTEIVGLTVTGVARAEGVRAADDGGLTLIKEPRHDAVVQRRRIEEHPHPGDDGQQRAYAEPEGVEHGQAVEQLVAGTYGEHAERLIAVGDDVEMAQKHGLGHALGARREHDRSRGFRGSGRGHAEKRRKRADGLVGRREIFGHIFKIHDAQSRFPEGLFHGREVGKRKKAA